MIFARFDSLKIDDVESLIELIDNCVSEANEYISYLSQKVEDLKRELLLASNANLEIKNEMQVFFEH